MCGLFGFTYYGDKAPRGLEALTRNLSVASTVRGTDATGISYVTNKGKMKIVKKNVDAYRFKFNLPDGTRAVMGHTRRTTQGNEKVNKNNHPFPGKVKSSNFALAHNGVLDNEEYVKATFSLPSTKVETDSYVAVQLIEHFNSLDQETLRQVGETVEGMFAFTILDEQNNLHIIRNDSPMSIVHFKSLKLYVYASTREILLEALSTTQLTSDAMWNGLKEPETISVLEPNEGSIWTIHNDGEIEMGTFEPQDRWGYNPLYSIAGGLGYNYTGGSNTFGAKLDEFHANVKSPLFGDEVDTYLEILTSELERAGYTRADLDMLFEEGYSTDDIEDAIYCNYLEYLISQCTPMCAEEVSKYMDDEEDLINE